MKQIEIIYNFLMEYFWEIISLIVGVVGAIYGIISRKKKKPTYIIRTIDLIKNNTKKIKSIDIVYQGEKIENLSISRIAIWNGGKETISSTDIAKNDKLKIILDGTDKILDFEVIFQKNSANDFQLKKNNDTTLEIGFDYFDYGEGVIVQIYHTASDNPFIFLTGSVKGVSKIKRNANFVSFINKDSKLNPKFYIFPKINILLLIILMSVMLFFNEEMIIFEIAWMNLLIQIFLAILVIISFYFLINLIKPNVPIGFKDFDKEF